MFHSNSLKRNSFLLKLNHATKTVCLPIYPMGDLNTFHSPQVQIYILNGYCFVKAFKNPFKIIIKLLTMMDGSYKIHIITYHSKNHNN